MGPGRRAAGVLAGLVLGGATVGIGVAYADGIVWGCPSGYTLSGSSCRAANGSTVPALGLVPGDVDPVTGKVLLPLVTEPDPTTEPPATTTTTAPPETTTTTAPPAETTTTTAPAETTTTTPAETTSPPTTETTTTPPAETTPPTETTTTAPPETTATTAPAEDTTTTTTPPETTTTTAPPATTTTAPPPVTTTTAPASTGVPPVLPCPRPVPAPAVGNDVVRTAAAVEAAKVRLATDVRRGAPPEVIRASAQALASAIRDHAAALTAQRLQGVCVPR